MERGQVRRREANPWWRLATLALILLSLLLIRSVYLVWQKNEKSWQVRHEAEEDLAAVAARHDALEARVKRLETPRGQEEEIRKNFPVAKEGEQVVIIFDEEEKATNTTDKEEGWWKSFWSND